MLIDSLERSHSLETFTEIKDFVDNPYYNEQRQKSLTGLNFNAIDAPVKEIVRAFAKLPYCFTLQSCYGHFLYEDQMNSQNIDPMPISDSIQNVEYRIAYIALCVKNGSPGRRLLQNLKTIQEIDPEYIQFGCAEWFWKKHLNSYVLQVEPKRFINEDTASVNYQEALHIEKTRNEFFDAIKMLT